MFGKSLPSRIFPAIPTGVACGSEISEAGYVSGPTRSASVPVSGAVKAAHTTHMGEHGIGEAMSGVLSAAVVSASLRWAGMEQWGASLYGNPCRECAFGDRNQHGALAGRGVGRDRLSRHRPSALLAEGALQVVAGGCACGGTEARSAGAVRSPAVAAPACRRRSQPA